MLTTLAAIFVNVILPVAIIVAMGYVAARSLQIDQRSVARVGLYVLVPCMTFAGMARSSISAQELGQIFAFVVLSVVLLWPISSLAARLLGLRGAEVNAFHLGTLLTNGANVGFPVLTLAWGAPALERGLIYAVAFQAIFQTVGVYLAAGGHLTPRDAVKRVLEVPGIYAMVAGLVVNWAQIPIPAFIFDPIKMVGDSLVPMLLVVLGMQLTEVRFRGYMKTAVVATVIRLGVSAILATGIAALLGLTGVTRQAMIAEASMPSAIIGLILAHEFNCHPRLVTAIISVTTVASMLTLTVVLSLL